jgi:hypothetical protein
VGFISFAIEQTARLLIMAYHGLRKRTKRGGKQKGIAA